MTAVLIERRKPCSLYILSFAFIFVVKLFVECPVPLFWDTINSSCVTQCPLFSFGNHTLAQCQPCKYTLITLTLYLWAV